MVESAVEVLVKEGRWPEVIPAVVPPPIFSSGGGQQPLYFHSQSLSIKKMNIRRYI
jgi:hypothetical protein